MDKVKQITDWCNEHDCSWRVRYEVCKKRFNCKITWHDETGQRPGASSKQGNMTIITEQYVPIAEGYGDDFMGLIIETLSQAKINYGLRKALP